MQAQAAIVLRLFERQWSGERGSLIPLHILNISRDGLKRIRSAAANIQGRNTGKNFRRGFLGKSEERCFGFDLFVRETDVIFYSFCLALVRLKGHSPLKF